MAEGKSPGLYGFPYEFYKSYWEFVGPDLYQVYLEAMRLGSLFPLINKENIEFIPKKGDLRLITINILLLC